MFEYRIDKTYYKCPKCSHSDWNIEGADFEIGWVCPHCKTQYEFESAKPASTDLPGLATTLKSWLDEAAEVTTTSRQQEYGNPLINFLRTAIEWTMWVQARKKQPVILNPIDVAWMMEAMKLAREMHTPKRDNGVDSIGYLSCADRIDGYMRELGYADGAAAFDTMTLGDMAALLERIGFEEKK